MCLDEMSVFVPETRKEFRERLELNHELIDIATWMKEQFEECCSLFEEITLYENLKEEYQNFVNMAA